MWCCSWVEKPVSFTLIRNLWQHDIYCVTFLLNIFLGVLSALGKLLLICIFWQMCTKNTQFLHLGVVFRNKNALLWDGCVLRAILSRLCHRLLIHQSFPGPLSSVDHLLVIRLTRKIRSIPRWLGIQYRSKHGQFTCLSIASQWWLVYVSIQPF